MDKLDHLGWVVSSSFAIGDVRFAVRSTSHAFGEWLSDTLGAYEVEDVEEFLYSVVVPEPPADGKAKEFFILYKGSSAIVRTLDPASLGRGLLAELEGHRLHERDDAVYVMASVAQVRGEPVMIPTSLGPGTREARPPLRETGRRGARPVRHGRRPGVGAGDPHPADARPARRPPRGAERARSLGKVADGLRFVSETGGRARDPRSRPGDARRRRSRRGRDTRWRT